MRSTLTAWLMIQLLPHAQGADEVLYRASPLTEAKQFTAGIEGPACDRQGNVFAVNFQKQQTIGRVTPAGKGEVWLVLPGKSTGNGIRFDRRGRMYIADYVGHNVLRVEPGGKQTEVFAHEPAMNQPNDLTITAGGTLYASDPDWPNSRGQIWKPPTESRSVRMAARCMSTKAPKRTSGCSQFRPTGRCVTSGCCENSRTTVSTGCAAISMEICMSRATARERWSSCRRPEKRSRKSTYWARNRATSALEAKTAGPRTSRRWNTHGWCDSVWTDPGSPGSAGQLPSAKSVSDRSQKSRCGTCPGPSAESTCDNSGTEGRTPWETRYQ